ncbi:GIY-YIG nuclease family protein [Roseovarius sp. SK2]|uniref:GIY-YIG nuclease family protein n=1 Tax=Roseovarius TaxID=74030 RepID=UPI00237A824C|nr:GIY-YIG nuclease family protein [Roseovarius sp. SK2]MDD9726161.1 GIY-YIG nuclease family protein [Roseovarius sp. SK2]
MNLHAYTRADQRYLEDERYDSATCLYRYYDPNDHLLYVGISNQPKRREERHWQEDRHWRQHAFYMTVEMYPTRKLAEIAEKKAIKNEDPEFNKCRLSDCGAEHAPRHAWYMEKCGGELKGEDSAIFDLCGYEVPEGYAHTFWTEPTLRSHCSSGQRENVS